MKFTVVTANQSVSVNLYGLQNCVQMNTKDLLGIEIVIRIKLQNTVGKQIRRKLLIGKAG